MCFNLAQVVFYLFILGLIFVVLPGLVIYALILMFKPEKLPYNLP